jgi:hypothetical protein
MVPLKLRLAHFLFLVPCFRSIFSFCIGPQAPSQQPWTPSAQQFLVEQMAEFFFGTGSALPSEYVPPSH